MNSHPYIRIDISGMPGSGKTCLAHRLADFLGNQAHQVTIVENGGGGRTFPLSYELSSRFTEPREIEIIVGEACPLPETSAVGPFFFYKVGDQEQGFDLRDVRGWRPADSDAVAGFDATQTVILHMGTRHLNAEQFAAFKEALAELEWETFLH